MTAGVYNTVANISSPSAATYQVVVVLTVNAPTVLSANPGSLQFNYSQGSTIPAAQALSIASSSPTAYTAAASAKWLLVGGGTGQTPGTVTVGVDPSTLMAGTTNVGYVSITPNNGFPAFFVPIVFFVFQQPAIDGQSGTSDF